MPCDSILANKMEMNVVKLLDKTSKENYGKELTQMAVVLLLFSLFLSGILK